jgi:tetratricopeptide (TPR) repeat protein
MVSPYSSGGGGTVLEHCYGAVLLSHLLLGDPVGELGDDVVPVSVRFQDSAFSPVDDLIVVGTTPNGAERRVSIGVRRAPKITAGDDATAGLLVSYLRVVVEHWEAVRAGQWRLALAVASPNPAVRQVRELAVVARGQPDDAAFRAAVALPGRVGKPVRKRLIHLDALVAKAAKGIQASPAQADGLTWRLLHALWVRELRLEEGDDSDQAGVIGRLRSSVPGADVTGAKAVFSALEKLSRGFAPSAATVTREMLWQRLSGMVADQPFVVPRLVPEDSLGTENDLPAGIVIGPAILGKEISLVLPPVVSSSLSGLRQRAPEFVGRSTVSAELLGVLDPASTKSEIARISGVAGLAGVGKTELALQVAHQAVSKGWFPGGVLMVDMQGYEVESKRLTPGQALNSLLWALSVPDQHIPSNTRDQERLYRAILGEFAKRDRAILVIIDNASTSAQVKPLLPGVGRAIVTSRHTLADLHGRLIDVDVLPHDASVELFARLLRLKRGDSDTRVEEHPADARRVVEFCGGLPLAVEIIAALLAAVPFKPLSALIEELTVENTRLTALRYEQLAVKTALTTSYRYLSDDQARLFRLLPVNPGPEVSTAAVAAMTELEEQEVRPLLEELTRAHLVEPGRRYDRWRMHDLVRLYAKEIGEAHTEDDGRQRALARLLEYYLVTSFNAWSHLNPAVTDPSAYGFANFQDGRVWLEAELPNLIASCEAAIEFVPESGILMARSLSRYLAWRGDIDERIRLITLAVTTARRVGDRDLEGKAVGDLAGALVDAGRLDDAVSTCEEAVALCEANGDRQGAGMALGNKANALRGLRRFDEAMVVCQDATAVFQATGHRRAEGLALSTLASIFLELGELEYGITAYREAAAILRETGDWVHEGVTLKDLSSALTSAGQHELAVDACQRAVEVYRAAGDETGEANALTTLSYALQEMEHHEAAVEVARQAVRIHQTAGRRDGEAAALAGLARAVARTDDAHEAVTACREAAEAYQEAGDRHGEGYALLILGVALHNTHQLEDAAIASREAITIARETCDQRNEAAALTNLGLTLIEMGDFAEAVTVCLAAISICREIDDVESAASALTNLGLALLKGQELDRNGVRGQSARFSRYAIKSPSA